MTDAICKVHRRARTGMATLSLIAVGLPGCVSYRDVYPFQLGSVLPPGDSIAGDGLWIRSADDRQRSLLLAIGYMHENRRLRDGRLRDISACFRYDPDRQELFAVDKAVWNSASNPIVLTRFPPLSRRYEPPRSWGFPVPFRYRNWIPAVGRLAVLITTCPRRDSVAVLSVEGSRYVRQYLIPRMIFHFGHFGRPRITEPCYLQMYSASDRLPRSKPVRLRIAKDIIPFTYGWSPDSRYLVLTDRRISNVFIIDTETLEEIEVPESEQSMPNADSE